MNEPLKASFDGYLVDKDEIRVFADFYYWAKDHTEFILDPETGLHMAHWVPEGKDNAS